jgi:CO/xanthine dehydrogenase Mo-binding subunit
VASKGLYAGGSAVKKAVENLLERTLGLASKFLGYPRDQLEHKDLSVYVRNNPSVSISFAELAAKEGGQISAEGVFDVPRAETTVPGSLQIPHIIHSYATAVAEVEVNTLNGRVKVRRILFVPEAGKVVNLDSYMGQCVGGLVQAMGYAIMEDVVAEDGVLRTTNFTTYVLPMAGDVPRIEVLPIDGFEPTGPLGAKGIAELPLTPVASAVANAIYDATGTRVFHLPATAERVYDALRSPRRPS